MLMRTNIRRFSTSVKMVIHVRREEAAGAENSQALDDRRAFFLVGLEPRSVAASARVRAQDFVLLPQPSHDAAAAERASCEGRASARCMTAARALQMAAVRMTSLDDIRRPRSVSGPA
jgi:hypothetical protein